MKKDVGLFIRVITCFLLVLCVLFVPSCKKSPSESSSGNSSDQATSETTPQPPDQTTAQVPDETNNTQETATGNDKSGWVPIDIKLPKAVFIGTLKGNIVL